MKYLVLTHKTLVLALLLCVPGSWQAVYADERDIEESLRRLEWLVQAQQKELQAQRKELVEQRALIRHLQQEQAKESKDAEKTPAVEPAADVASTDQGKAPALPDGTQSQADNTQQPSTTIDTVVPATSDDDKESGQQAAIAELAKREREGTADADDEQDSVWLDDPSNTLYDPDFLGAWHLPGTTAAMKIGGYVNLAIVSSLDPLLSTDRFIVGTIPPQGQDVPGAKSGTAVTAGQSRLNIEVREQTRKGQLRAFLEGDFEGNGDTFRLRHAYGQYRSMLAGKTWTTLMDIDSRPEEVDFEGINGEVLLRQPQLRFFPRVGEFVNLKVALEDPSTEVVNGQGARGNADLILSVDRLPLGSIGSWNSRIGFALRNLEAQQPGSDPDGEPITDGTTGWGITISGKKSLTWWGEEDYVLGQLTYGKGIGRYINDLNTIGGGDAVFDPEGNLHALPVFAGYFSYRHRWPKNFWFLKNWPGIMRSNLTISWVYVDNFDFQKDQDYQSTFRTSFNLLYSPTHNLRLGAELLWGERKNKDNSKGTATQLQVSARYDF